MDVSVLSLGVRVLKLRTREVVLLGGNIGEYLKKVGQSCDKDGQGGSSRDNGQQVDDKWGKEGGQADRRVGKDGDSEQGGRVTVGTWIIPSVVGAIEEVLNDLVGGSNVNLVDIINL